MQKSIQAVRGMNDIVPEKTPYWQCLEDTLRRVSEGYGYREIRFPVVESTDLFKRTIGEATDIVEKEMYTFEDRNGDSLTLRPEGTAGCVRAAIQQSLLYNQIQRFWYKGPMFRHERPQKGRYRQFHQFGIEAFGMFEPAIDAELILLSARVWRELGIADSIWLEINSLGTAGSRAHYREQLVAYLTEHQAELDEDSQRRLSSNPLRILDSKNPAMQSVIAAAPKLADYLDQPSRDHFDGLLALLDEAKIKYKINPTLVRGLDYYDFTVFEWVTDRLGAQGTVCAGGRYNQLVEQLGGRPTPACGFALGYERVVALIEQQQQLAYAPMLYIISNNGAAQQQALMMAEQLRNQFANHQRLGIICDCVGGSFKSQFKRADKSGAAIAFIIGEDELANNTVSVKFLRERREQQQIAVDKVADFLMQQTKGSNDGDV